MRQTLVAFAVALVAIACTRAHGEAGFGSLTVQEVNQKCAQQNVFIYDNNEQARWVQGHVPGAKWIDPGKIKASDLPADKTATLIFYCANEH